MIKEDYVSYEVAKLLKEKGFDEICDHYIDCHWEEDGVLLHTPCKSSDLLFGYMCPTHQMAMKWLREVHKISIDICTVQGKEVSYMFNIWDFTNIHDNKYIGGTFDLREQLYGFNTYEEAVETALKYCLTELI